MMAMALTSYTEYREDAPALDGSRDGVAT